jgi:hypothetical protein
LVAEREGIRTLEWGEPLQPEKPTVALADGDLSVVYSINVNVGFDYHEICNPTQD